MALMYPEHDNTNNHPPAGLSYSPPAGPVLLPARRRVLLPARRARPTPGRPVAVSGAFCVQALTRSLGTR